MPVQWEDIEPIQQSKQTESDWSDIEPLEGAPKKAEDSPADERMMAPSAFVPPIQTDPFSFNPLQPHLPVAPEGTVGEDISGVLNQDLIPVPQPLSAEELRPYIPGQNKTGSKVAAGAFNVLTQPGRFMNTPLGLFTLGAGPVVQRLLGLAFAPGMVKSGAEQLGEASAEGDIQKAIEGAGSLGFGGLVALPEAKSLGRAVGDKVPLTKGDVQRIAFRDLLEQVNKAELPMSLRQQLEGVPYASSIPEATAIHGDVRPQPRQGEGQMPVEESRPGVQSRSQELPETAQVLLSPEDQTVLKTARESVDAPVEFSTTTEGAPAAGEIATINRKTGSIVINPKEFSDWLKNDVPAKSRDKAVRSLLWEEKIHLAVDDASAMDYWNTLTVPERAIAIRRYTGRWGGTRAAGAAGELTATDLGHEALRFRMQQLARMEPREIAEAAFKEKWTLKGLTAVESGIRTAREALDTKASGTGKAIVDRMQSNLDIAKAIAAGTTPSAIRKYDIQKPTEDELPSTPFVSKGVAKPAYGEQFYRKQGNALKDPQFWVDWTYRHLDPKLNGQESTYQVGLYLRKLGMDEAAPIIKALGDARAILNERRTAALEKAETAPTPEARMDALRSEDYALGFGPIQFPREAVESAFDRGSAKGMVPRSAAEPLKMPETIPSREPEIESVSPLEYESGRPLSGMESMVQRLEGRPSAIRKSQVPKETKDVLLPPIQTKETQPKPITPTAVESSVQGHMTQSARPSFSDFAEAMRKQFGNVQRGQLREAWVEGVWKNLMAAPGSELMRLRRTMGLGKEFGLEGEIVDPPAEGKLPVAPETGKLSSEAMRLKAEGDKAQRARVNYRYNVIATIGEKLIGEAETGKKAWHRNDVTPEEIGFWRKSSQPALTTISPSDIRNTETLGKMLTADARQEASTRFVRAGKGTQGPVEVRRKAPPVSVTKRITALLNKATGKVELVSTYRDGRRGPVLLDPESPGKTHSQLSSILNRYRPIYSFLLDEPVQNFRKTFKSVSEFNRNFLEEARSLRSEYASAQAALTPEAGVIEPVLETPGVLEIGGKLTDAEAGSFLDNLYDEVSKLESPEDVRLLVESLHDKFQMGELSGRDWQTISALQKATDAIQRKWPQLTPDQAKEQAFDELFDIASKAKTRDDFTSQTVQRYSPEAGGAVSGEPQAAPQREGSRELTMRERVPPTVQRGVPIPKGPGPEPTLPPPKSPEMLSPEAKSFVEAEAERPKLDERQLSWPYPAESTPKALRKSKAYAEDQFLMLAGKLSAWTTRRQTKKDIVAWRDGADTIANNDARKVGNSIRVQSKNPLVRAAAKAVIAAGGNKSKLELFANQIQNAKRQAQRMIQEGRLIAGVSGDTGMIGKRWLEAATRLENEVNYAFDHWNDKELQSVARTAQNELAAELEFEKINGMKIDPVEDYVPGRYEAEFFNDKAVMFGERILGRQFRKPKSFENYYSAIEAGPYIPKSYDIADLVEHRVRSGRGIVNRDLWLKSLAGLKDPMSGQMVVTRPKIVNGEVKSPSPEYELFSLGHGKELVAVRLGYKDLLDAMTQPSGIQKWAGGRAVMGMNGLLKHGVILILDSFHPFRLGQYALALMGPAEAGYRGGWSALEYRPSDLAKAVEKGYVTKESAEWAGKSMEVTIQGRKMDFTRREILDEMQRAGLNVGRIQDAIYSDLVRSWPIVGTMNKWTFDIFTRGLMAESAVRSFEKLNQKYPNRDARQTMREVIRDVNLYYGSIGRQGWIRSPTLRDISQIIFLAPQWVEGLLQKELRTYGRVLKSPYSVYKGDPILGVLGSGMAKGFVSYLVLTQVLNLITRRHLTFQNPEEDHKLDAWIPTGEKEGFWLSPMSVFAEVTHDIERLGTGKPAVWEAYRQVGANKLGPFGRMLMTMASRETSEGKRITSTPQFLLEEASQLTPSPISLGTPVRYLASKIAPGYVSPPRPGAMQQRALGAAGIKVQPGETSLQQAQHLATKFAEKNKLKKDTGFILVPTDEASYSKLRNALRIGDEKGAKSIMADLRKTRKDSDIIKAMMIWTKRPLTGSWKGEIMWLQQMNDYEFKTYGEAMRQRQELWNKFVTFYQKS